VDRDLFSSVIHHIIGQQISTAAQKTIWGRIHHTIEHVTVDAIDHLSRDEIQAFGMTFRKAEYIKDFTTQVKQGKFVLEDIAGKTDEQIIQQLTSLHGIGVWTAEMIMIFCLQRPNILSYDDLAIQRGLRMLYHHKSVDKSKFETYRKRYSPYATVASLYLWEIARGAIDGLKDYGSHNRSG
jgi:DNA-3-methyladenine glycosylase II